MTSATQIQKKIQIDPQGIWSIIKTLLEFIPWGRFTRISVIHILLLNREWPRRIGGVKQVCSIH